MTVGDLYAAWDAGAATAASAIRAQLQAGMSTDQIEQSAERVLADQGAYPVSAGTGSDAAFYDAYAQVATTYVTAARVFGLDADAEAEVEPG